MGLRSLEKKQAFLFFYFISLPGENFVNGPLFTLFTREDTLYHQIMIANKENDQTI
jgi:hypothetical protein